MPADILKVDPAMLGAMERAQVSPRLIYACRKTGLLVDDEGYRRLSPDDRKAWDEAVEEFDRVHGQ